MEYTKEVQEHFVHPHNLGEIENPDGRGRAGNVRCGDVMLITLKLKGDIIDDIRFKTFGCAAAVATASVVTDLAKGKTLDKAAEIKFQEIVDVLHGLPPQKMHCSALAITTLRLAIKNARGESDGEEKSDAKENCADECPVEDCPKVCPKCPKRK